MPWCPRRCGVTEGFVESSWIILGSGFAVPVQSNWVGEICRQHLGGDSRNLNWGVGSIFISRRDAWFSILCVINKRLQIFSIKKADAKTGFMRHQITGRYAGDPCTFTQMPREFGPSPAEHWAFRKIADVGPKTSVSRNMLSFCVQSWGLYVYVYTKRYVCVYVFIYFPLGIFTSSIDRISFTDVIIPAKPEILKHFVSGPLCAPKNVWELERALVYVGFIKWYLLHQELKLVNFKVFIKLLQSDNNTFITC